MACYEPRWFIPGLVLIRNVLRILGTEVILSRLPNQKGDRFLPQSVDRDCIQNRTPGSYPGVLKISFGCRRTPISGCYRSYSRAGICPTYASSIYVKNLNIFAMFVRKLSTITFGAATWLRSRSAFVEITN